MNLLAFLSMLILIITIITLVFGVITYFLYKTRESSKKTISKEVIYEEVLGNVGGKYVFFE
jgi:heme/copper-type cytochrome/quinol oxidase subunit 2